MPKKKAARKSAGPKPADGQSAKRNRGRPGQTSKHRGVSWDRSKWVVQIRRNGVLKKLGRFAEEEEAAAAYRAAEAAIARGEEPVSAGPLVIPVCDLAIR